MATMTMNSIEAATVLQWLRNCAETYRRHKDNLTELDAAMTLISTVGGASGPLYGTFFLQAVAGANGKMTLTHEELAAVMQAALQGLMARGKAVVGDKTMVDALAPAVE